MIVPILAKIPIIMHFIAVIWFILAVALILLVLLQKGRGGGLGAAIGGGMAQSLLGSKTGDFLTWVTICVCILFLSIAVLMAKYYKPVTPRLMGPAQTQSAPEVMPAEGQEAAEAAPMPDAQPELPAPPAPEMPEAPETEPQQDAQTQ